MKTFYFIFILLFVISCQKDIASKPTDYLSKEEFSSFKSSIVRYYEGLPKNASHQTKWDTLHNDYYFKKTEATDLLHYYKNEDGFVYFAVAKIAPSIKLKKVSTIGKLKFEKDSIIYYEEICRTWKMELPELKEKTKILFDKIVNNKDVSQYYTKNLPENEYWIEFPDDQTVYNVELREWQTKK
jgi:hypothetical protein